MPCEGPVHLRRAVVDDAPGIADVYVKGWLKAHAGVVPEEYLDRVGSQRPEQSWREQLEVAAADRNPWVALLDDRLIGFANGGITRDDDADSGTGEVYLLFVDPECWKQGIRTNLMDHVLRDLLEQGFSRASYWVMAEDAEGREFAEYMGFGADGTNRFEDRGGTRVEEVRYTRQLR